MLHNQETKSTNKANL